MARRLRWTSILEHAVDVVLSYDTGVTLRQLFYRLVAAVVIPNNSSAYKTLSSRTAAARRDGWFPALSDNTREITRSTSFTDPGAARRWLADIYRRDRTEGQVHNIFIAVEKRTMLAQLEAWFGELGLPIVALGGYSSQTLEADVVTEIERDGRPAVLLYAGDFDASGEDILRNLVDQVQPFDKVVRVALTPEQIDEYELPVMPGKRTDSRAAAFERRHGALVQVELEALAPETLRDLYDAALSEFWDTSAYDAVMAIERRERRELR